jgi:excisionase family DNA binding protein
MKHKWMSVNEYSKMAGIGTETVHQLIDEGKLTATKIGDGKKCEHIRILVKEDERIDIIEKKLDYVIKILENSKVLNV